MIDVLPASNVVALAASAGGLRAISSILAALPGDFPAAILIVQHLDPRHRSLMAQILARSTPLQVKEAADHDIISHSWVYVAPPNRHLLVSPDRHIELSDAAQVHFVRPSADLLFESAASVFGDRAIAVVLSGTGADGSDGVQAIKRNHGTVLVQGAPEFDGMPSAAIHSGTVDQVVGLEEIPDTLVSLVAQRQAS